MEGKCVKDGRENKPWISQEILENIDERKKNMLINARIRRAISHY